MQKVSLPVLSESKNPFIVDLSVVCVFECEAWPPIGVSRHFDGIFSLVTTTTRQNRVIKLADLKYKPCTWVVLWVVLYC